MVAPHIVIPSTALAAGALRPGGLAGCEPTRHEIPIRAGKILPVPETLRFAQGKNRMGLMWRRPLGSAIPLMLAARRP